MSSWLTNTEAFEFKAQLAFFKLSHPIDHFSMFLALASLLITRFPITTMVVYGLLGLTLLFYVIQKYYAIRICYDVALLEAWGNSDAVDLKALDQALLAQLNISPTQKNLPDRLLGVRRLFKKQTLFIGLQLLSLTATLVFFAWLDLTLLINN